LISSFLIPDSNGRLVAFLLFSIYLFSLVYSLVLFVSIRVKGTNVALRVWPGEWVTARWFIRNLGFLPAPVLYLSDTAGGMEVLGSLTKSFGIGPRQTLVFEYKFRPRTRGLQFHGPMTMKFYDPLGLFPMTRPLTGRRSILVYPFLSFDFPPLKAPGANGGLRTRWSIMTDNDRIRGWKEYEAGDELRNLDPYLSARFSHPMIRLLESTLRRRLWVLIDWTKESYPFRGRSAFRENAVSLAAGLLYKNWSQGQAGGLVAIGASGLSLSRFPPAAGIEHLVNIMEVLAELQDTQILNSEEDQTTWLWSQLRHGDLLVSIGPPPTKQRESELFAARRRGIETVLIVLGTSRLFYGADSRLGVHLVEGLE